MSTRDSDSLRPHPSPKSLAGASPDPLAEDARPEPSEFPAPVFSRHEPRIAGATDRGRVRSVNQDAFGRFDDPERAEIVLVVADGLGGHRGGEVASRLAVDTIGRTVFEGSGDRPSRLHRAIEEANEAIGRESVRDVQLDGMGTTVVVLLLAEEGTSHVGHVGDSRLYRLRDDAIESVTEDHSLVATLVREGVMTEEEARVDPRRNQILRALGVSPKVEVSIDAVETRAGDTFLLCTDGLHGSIEDGAIAALAGRPLAPEPIVSKLIEAANEAGGSDNITCLLAQVPDPERVHEPTNVATRLFESTRSVFSRRDPR